MNIYTWFVIALLTVIVFEAWELWRTRRQVTELQDEVSELEAELRTTDRKLRRAQEELRTKESQ